MSSDLVIGWALGLVSSLVTALLLFWLEGKRSIRNEQRVPRREDIRAAQNWKPGENAVSLRGFDLRGANLSGRNLSGANLEDANLEGVSLWGGRFIGSNLIRASFRKAQIRGTDFTGANLHLADFTGAVIREANFSQAKLRRTKLGRAKEIADRIWEGAKIDETTDLPSSIRDQVVQLAPATTHMQKESDGSDAQS